MKDRFRNNILDSFRKIPNWSNLERIAISMLPFFQKLSGDDVTLMEETIKEMEADGIINIENHSNPRLILMVLTEDGKKLL